MFRTNVGPMGEPLDGDDDHVTSGSFVSSTDEWAGEAVFGASGEIIVAGVSREE